MSRSSSRYSSRESYNNRRKKYGRSPERKHRHKFKRDANFKPNLERKYSDDDRQRIEINELNLEKIQPNSRTYMNPEQGGHKIVVIGKPGTGKSYLISSLLYAKKHIFPVGMVVSGTEDSNGFYQKMFPSTFVFNKYNEEQLRKFIQRQKIAKKHLSNPWAVCLLDDCMDEPAVFRKSLQLNMYKNGRHYKMLYIVSLQYCLDIRPAIRTNVDGCFILREPNVKNRRALYENYASIIPDFGMFCDIMDQLTDDYTALYIHNASKVNNWKECIFYYKAKQVPKDFKFGCKESWQFHNTRYNPEYVDPLLP